MMRALRRFPTVLLALAIGLAACAPAGSPGPQTAAGPGRAGSTAGRALHSALYEPPALGGAKFNSLASLRDYTLLFGAELAAFDAAGNPIPRLAAEVPSLQAGTLRVLDDSRMETIHRLRPGLTWHDGMPFTVDDVIFTWEAIMNPELRAGDRNPERLIETIEAIDAATFRIRWKEPFIYADAWDLEPLPKHILDPVVQRDPQGFVNTPFWNTEWVGLGPYRLAEWVPGSHVKGVAFPGYALGAPQIEEVYVHFVTGAPQAVAGMLAGTLDLPLGNLLNVDEAMVLKQQLETQGEASVLTNPFSLRVTDFQFRDPSGPAARDVRVRRAVVHAVDRPLMVDSLLLGLTLPAYSFVFPNDATYARVDEAIAKYPYDANRARQLLAEAGWERGSDGVLRTESGQRFTFGVHTLEGTQYVKEAQVVVDAWRALGIAAELEVIPRAQQNNREYRASFTGAANRSMSRRDWAGKWRTDQIPNESNQWRPDNRGAFANPAVDRLSTEFRRELDPAKRADTVVQFFRVISEEVPSIPFYYLVRVYAIRAGLKGVDPPELGEGDPMFNVHRMRWE
jgi:peptide/nickel transport system substrate-binding protein